LYGLKLKVVHIGLLSFLPLIKPVNILNSLVESEAIVNFFGDNSYAAVSLERIISYNEGYAQFSKTKKKNLLEAIEIANKISAGINNEGK